VQTWSGCTTIPTYDNDYRDPTKSELWHFINDNLEVNDPVENGAYEITVDGAKYTYDVDSVHNSARVKSELLKRVDLGSRPIGFFVHGCGEISLHF
jgi:hypothetical protein